MHWTYEAIVDGRGDLEQGDIIHPTDALRTILRQVHAHFDDDKYLCYCIATQSCDLVKRNKSPKAKYISIAAVRSLKSVFPSLFSDIELPIAPDVFRRKSKDKAQQLLSRILNQNEQALGLFYLHPDAEIGLGESAVVYLRVAVALKAQHYDTLVDSRRGRLTAEFRSKFGWLLGNLYSRAATRDWDDDDIGKEEQKQIINSQLETSAQTPETGLMWIDDELVSGARKASVSIETIPRRELAAALEPYRPRSAFDLAVEDVLAAAKEALKIAEGDPRLKHFQARLNGIKKYTK